MRISRRNVVAHPAKKHVLIEGYLTNLSHTNPPCIILSYGSWNVAGMTGELYDTALTSILGRFLVFDGYEQ